MINFAGEEAQVVYNPSRVSLKDIVRAIRNLGYNVFKEELYFTLENISVDEEPIIEDKLRRLPGVIDVKVSHVAKSVSVVFNPLSISTDSLRKAY